ncbi:MAG: hypothetical protein U9N72_09165 [Bacteroidota bacterium]|nr:hypothetical protein [Bacteroidota bacterium]
MRNNRLYTTLLLTITGTLILSSCATIPEGATAVTPFDKEKYLKIASRIGYNTSDLTWVEHNEEQH